MLGDFNFVRKYKERLDEEISDSSAAEEFNSCLEDIDTEDMPSKGFWFTWTNKRGGVGDIKSRISRDMVNSAWKHCFPDSEAVFSAHGTSDAEVSRKKPVKIFNFWMNNTKFTRLLQGSWSQEIVGSPMLR